MNAVLRALLAALTAAFIGLVAFSLRDTSAREGAAAPAFSIRTDEGSQVTADRFGGKVLVLNFWASWCAPCVQEIPSLSQFQKRFAADGVRVVAISIDKNPNRYRTFLQRVPVAFATAWDPQQDISNRYGTYQIPESYIIKNGRVMRKFANSADWTSPDVTDYVKGLL